MPYVRRYGFTLVELLIVIAIISVLAAMLLPALQNAVEGARRMECVNRMKQFMLLTHDYENETGRFLPAYYYPAGSTDQQPGTRLLHEQYFHETGAPAGISGVYGYATLEKTRASSLFTCPSRTYVNYWPSHPKTSWPKGSSLGIFLQDFSINTYLNYPAASYPKHSGQLRIPASRFLYWTGWHTRHNNMVSYGYFRNVGGLILQGVNLASYVNGDESLYFAHAGMQNFACYDGHVGSYHKQLYVDAYLNTITEKDLPFSYQNQ